MSNEMSTAAGEKYVHANVLWAISSEARDEIFRWQKYSMLKNNGVYRIPCAAEELIHRP